jgi:hypothetical protein
MKTKIFAVFAGFAVIVATGCVRTVGGTHSPAVNAWGQDRFVNKYQRPADQVYQASLAVIKSNGVLLTASNLYNTTNSERAIYGKVNQRNVWINVEPLDPNITQVTVQVRSPIMGIRDLNLAHELGEEIGLQLQAMPSQ